MKKKKRIIRPPRHLAQLSICKKHSNSLKIKWIQRLLNPTSMLSGKISIEFNSEFLSRLNPFLDRNRTLVLTDTKICKNRTMKISLFNYLMLSHTAPVTTSVPPTSIEEILDQPTFLNPHTKLDFSFDNAHLYSILRRNISDKFTIIRDLRRFLQPGLISTTTFDEKRFFYCQTKEYINLLRTRFPKIGSTYLALKLLKNPF